MTSELINTLLILGAAQSLFLAALLASRKTNSVANMVLAVAMLAFSIFIFQGVYYAQEYYDSFPQFIGISTPLTFVFGPILYLYAKTVSKGEQTFRKISLIHFIPFVLVTLYLVPFYTQDGAAKIAFLHKLLQEGPSLDVAIIEHLQYPHGIFYIFLTIRLLRHHQTRLKDTHSSIERINLRWLQNLTIGIVAVWVLATGLHLMDITGLGLGELEPSLTQLAVSFVVYTIGYLGLRQPDIFHSPALHGTVPSVERSDVDANNILDHLNPNPPIISTKPVQGSMPEGQTSSNIGYQKSGLTQAEAEALTQQLLHLMEKKQLFKRTLLTLPELADEMSISAHNLSEVINTQLEKNFYDFVNSYRIEEAKQRLSDPQYSYLTILAIAEESGFNSKSSFNAFFKKHTGLTPFQYRTQHREEA